MSAAYGPWTLRPGRDYRDLVERLNRQFAGKHLVVTKTDTSDFPYGLATTGWYHIDGEVRIDPGNEHFKPSLDIPIGLGITLPIAPCAFEDYEGFTLIDINGDHVQISRPYLFHSTPQRVDSFIWSITSVRKDRA